MQPEPKKETEPKFCARDNYMNWNFLQKNETNRTKVSMRGAYRVNKWLVTRKSLEMLSLLFKFCLESQL